MTPTIEDQIALEKRMVSYGVSRYRAGYDRATEEDRTAETAPFLRLVKEFVEPVADSIQQFVDTKTPGVNAKYKAFLRQVDPMSAALIGLRCVFNNFITGHNIHSLGRMIGTQLEDDVHFAKFEKENGDYYSAIIRDFKRKHTTNYNHIHRVLTFKANETGLKWNSWTTDEKIQVGIKVIDCIMEATDLLVKTTTRRNNKTVVEVRPSEATLEWVKDYNGFAELTTPDRLPCIIPPDDWTAYNQGGYYTPQMRKRSPLVKTRYKEHEKMFEGDISNITDVINTIQQVPWRVNKDVLGVLQTVWDNSLGVGLPRAAPYEIPVSPVAHKKDKAAFTEEEQAAFILWKEEARNLYTMEQERVAKGLQVVRVLHMAKEFNQYDRFWYVYQCDFRGRIYTTCSGLSPQSADFAKALLQFAEGKPLTDRGVYWFKVHGANTFGVDKLSYEDRIKWVDENDKYILRVAEDPLGTTDFWGEADKPWQFLAWCFEYAKYRVQGASMISHLPIGLDGSCNGLQNFSAMLRDNIGGRATNLVPQHKPSDIYSEVSSVFSKRVLNDTTEVLAPVRAYLLTLPDKTFPRGISKRSVMTLPYGCTKGTCREYIYQYFVTELADHFHPTTMFKLSMALVDMMWDSIGEVVVAAREAMDYLQESASKLAKANKPISWWTPMGFPVFQGTRHMKLKRVRTQLQGQLVLVVAQDSARMSVTRNKLGIAPNFVHSMDACHLMMTCQRAKEYGVNNFAFIHDDYGTHAADTDTLHQSIREAFVEMYTHNDPLFDFKIYNEDASRVVLKDIPKRGTLKLDEVIDSDYFFG